MSPDPLELPVQKLEFVCHADRPVSFWPWDQLETPLETVLAKSLGAPPPGPVYIRVIDDFDDCPRADFELEVTLWGRRAIGAREEIRAAIHRMGTELNDPAPFTVEERDPHSARTLRELADDLPRIARRLTLTIETPLDVDWELDLDDDGVPTFDFLGLAVEAAQRLTLFDLEDREEQGPIDKVAHAEEVVRRCRAALAPLRQGFYTMGQEWVGEEDCTAIGWTGHCEYERPTPEAWPWLLALALGRAGRRRHEGFGAFSFWVQAGP